MALQYCFDDAITCLRVGHICDDVIDLSIRVARPRFAAHANNGGSLHCEQFGSCPSDAGRCPSHEYYSILQFKVHLPALKM